LRALVEMVIRELAEHCADRDIEWQVADLPTVNCDPGLMKQVFVDLLDNAVKYTRPRQHAIIEIGHRETDQGYLIFVRDNGAGFDMKYAAKLFGVFERLHRQEDFEGTGVGLATVQRIIQKHGGRIWAEAEEEKGATFYFTLDADKEKLTTVCKSMEAY
jgi:light-regulated signal transduction histidine kinase (bacteriophytochrome)